MSQSREMNILILDIGTSSARGIVYNESGYRLASAQVKNCEVFSDEGQVTEPVSDWIDHILEILGEIGQTFALSRLSAVAVTAQRSSVIPVDSSGRALMDTIMWQDRRSAEICRRLVGDNERIFAATGSRVNPVFSAGKMMWVLENRPELKNDVYKFLNIPEYIMLQMTGSYETDLTYGCRSGLMDIRSATWSGEELRRYGVREEQLCRLHAPGSIVGRVTERFAGCSGLPAGIPVITAGGDQQCAALGQGVYREGDLSVNVGTGGYVTAACSQVPQSLRPDVTCSCAAMANTYLLEANLITCSIAYDSVIRTLYGEGEIDFTAIEEELKKESEPTSCLVLPYFNGRGTPDWNPTAKAAFIDVTLATRRSEILKAAVEGILLELKNQVEVVEQYVPVKTVFGSGGMTKSPCVRQLLTDIFGENIRFRTDEEATAYGAFLNAMVALNLFSSMDEAQRSLNEGKGVVCRQPDLRKHALYEEKRERMKTLYSKLYQ